VQRSGVEVSLEDLYIGQLRHGCVYKQDWPSFERQFGAPGTNTKHMAAKKFVLGFDKVSSKDTNRVGGKNAALGEMIRALKRKGVRVPDGFATIADAFRLFVRENKIDRKIRAEIQRLKKNSKSLPSVGKTLRALFVKGKFPEQVEAQIREAYRELCQRYKTRSVDVAVRSSATAEDLPEASFAGQQETFLNISGEDAVVDACRKCYASLFTDRAINYREERNFDHFKIALSTGVQKMVHADKACAGAGVMFSIDTESGFPNVVRISAALGSGRSGRQRDSEPRRIHDFQAITRQEKGAADPGKIARRQETQSRLRAERRPHDAHGQHHEERARILGAQRRRNLAPGEMGLRD
jgi:pyruvate, water dikinase